MVTTIIYSIATILSSNISTASLENGTPAKTNMPMEKQSIKDVFPIKNNPI